MLGKKKDKLHLLKGLKRILLDIDKAIKIIRETEEETEVIPNLMIGFGIDQVQAEYVAEIKLRNINKEYILKRVRETDALGEEIEDLEDLLNSPPHPKKVIVERAEDAAAKKYGEPRRTSIVFSHEIEEYEEEEPKEDYPVTLFLSREGYFKKITAQSLRMSGEQKFKEGDELPPGVRPPTTPRLMFFTDHQQVYKVRLPTLPTARPRAGGLSAHQAGDGRRRRRSSTWCCPGITAVMCCSSLKTARRPGWPSAYATTSNRRKLTGAYSDKSPLAALIPLTEDRELAPHPARSPGPCCCHTALLAPKTTRATQGVAVMNMKPRYHLDRVCTPEESGITNLARYRVRSIPLPAPCSGRRTRAGSRCRCCKITGEKSSIFLPKGLQSAARKFHTCRLSFAACGRQALRGFFFKYNSLVPLKIEKKGASHEKKKNSPLLLCGALLLSGCGLLRREYTRTEPPTAPPIMRATGGMCSGQKVARTW